MISFLRVFIVGTFLFSSCRPSTKLPKPGEWTAPYCDSSDFVFQTILNDSVLYLNTSRSLFCLDTTGKLLWKFEKKSTPQRSFLNIGLRIILFNNSNLTILNPQTGKAIWTKDFRFVPDTKPLFIGEAIYFVSGNLFCKIFCNDTASVFFYSYLTDNFSEKKGAFCSSSYVGLVTNDSIRICSISLDNGKKLWEYTLDKEFDPTGATPQNRIVVDDSIAVLYLNNNISCFKSQTGRLLWTVPAPNSKGGFACMKIFKDKIFLEDGSFLSCINSENGKTIWEKKSQSQFTNPPFVKNNSLYAIMDGDSLCVLSAQTGNFQLGFSIHPGLSYSSEFIVQNEYIYFTSDKAIHRLVTK